MHSTAVRIAGRAVILLGTWGAGKTMTSLRLARVGARILAGDLAVLTADGMLVGGSRPVLARAEGLQCWSSLLGSWAGAGHPTNRGRVDLTETLMPHNDAGTVSQDQRVGLGTRYSGGSLARCM